MEKCKKPKARQGLSQKNWLNIIIVSISAMLLLSVLIGRMLEKTEQTIQQNQRRQAIVEIDFGDVQLNWQDGQWQSSDPQIQAELILMLVNRWNHVLFSDDLLPPIAQKFTTKHQEPMVSQSHHEKIKVSSTKNVILYLDSQKSPVIAKLIPEPTQIKIVLPDSGIEIIRPLDELPFYYPIIETN